ncbi:hypothetical protein GIB67_033734 [Kingdonia uniflora]|uniref:Uncharacterized protein n=1 Tax=Kingdonia uniflora TaxID=39325 RepID=A0A7J7P4K1_9MAGN|nr:hypothetical protein GIB67_033734 [Kingdonia uniflora]
MAFWDLLFTASIPVMEVLFVTALGAFIATERIGILSKEAIEYMNQVVFYVLNPALVGSKLADTITAARLVKMWFMPINILLTFFIGSALGWILIKLTRPPKHLRALILGVCSAGNLGNLLIIIVPAICEESNSPFGDSTTCSSYGLAYASLSMAMGAIYIWSYVYNIVRIASVSCAVEILGSPSMLEYNRDTPELLLSDSYAEPLLSSVSEVNADQFTLPSIRSDKNVKVKVPFSVKLKEFMLSVKVNVQRLLSPSICGAIVGFIIGLIPQIRKTVIGDSAPLRVIQNSADLVGEGAIPVLTLIIGGNLLKGLKGPQMQKSVIVGIMVVRYILLPLIGIAVVKGAHHIGFVHSDPLYQFVLMLQFALPPAANISTITQLFGAGASECSVIMLWTYAFASIAITLWATFYLWLVA